MVRFTRSSAYLLIFIGLLYGWEASAAPLRIVQIKAYDQGAFGEDQGPDIAVDVVQGKCGDDPAMLTDEKFFDSVVGVTIANNGSTTVLAQKFSYHIQRSDGSARPFKAIDLSPLQGGEIAPGESKEIFFLFLKTQNGGKAFTRSSTNISSTLGFRNVTVRVKGQDGRGRPFSIRRRTALSFGNYDRCE